MKRFSLVDLGLVVSSLTSVVFLVGIARLDRSGSTPAFASGVTASSGEYVVTVGSLTDRDEEMVYVINSANQKMASYRYEVRSKALELVQQLDLEDMRKSVTTAPKGGPSKVPPKTP